TTAISRRPMRIDPSTCPLQRKRKRLLPASGAGGFGLARDLFGRAERLQHVRAPRPGSSRESRARTGRRRPESRKSTVPQRNRAHTRELAVPIETGAARPHNPLAPCSSPGGPITTVGTASQREAGRARRGGTRPAQRASFLPDIQVEERAKGGAVTD